MLSRLQQGMNLFSLRSSAAACVEALFLSCLDTVMLPNDVIVKM